MIDIYEIVAIFQFFHNGQCWYSVFVDTQKTGDPNFGGVSTLKIFYMIDIYEMVAIFSTDTPFQDANFPLIQFWILHWFSFPHHPS